MREDEAGGEMNLVVVTLEVEIGTRELGLDDLPEPIHRRTKRDITEIGCTCATGEEGGELAEGVNDDGPRVSFRGERAVARVVGVDYFFNGIKLA